MKKTDDRIECGRAYLLWDGDCNFCRKCSEVASRLDERSTFVVAPHQNFSDEELKKAGLDHRRCARELQVVTASGKVFGGAFAVNYFCWQQSRLRVLALLGLLFPVLVLVEVLVYKFVAKNRGLVSDILFRKAK